MPQKSSSMIGRQYPEPTVSAGPVPTHDHRVEAEPADGAVGVDGADTADGADLADGVDLADAADGAEEAPRSQADVMRRVISLRHEAERHLSESAQVRQAALVEAELTLDSAQEAAELLQAQAQERADVIVGEAREHAIGIVEAARMEAEQVRSDVAQELDRLREERRLEAAADARADFSGLAETASSLSSEMATSFAALREALDRAQSLTAGVADRLERVALPEPFEEDTAPDAATPTPDALDEQVGGQTDEPPTDGAPVDAVLVTSASDDDSSDDEAGNQSDDEPEVVEEIEVVDDSETAASEADDDAATTPAPIPEPVAGVGRAPSSAPTLRSESHESARPLGWLFRQPQP